MSVDTSQATRCFATLTFMRGSLLALGLALLAGMLAVLYYIPGLSKALSGGGGLEFAALRPLHTTFASAWIFLAGQAVVHRYLQDKAGEVTGGERWRLRVQVVLWALAGAGILITLPLGITSGREYMGFHPLLSVPILLGWLLFAWNFFRATWRGFWDQPVYVTMWGAGTVFFVVTFIEQHAWLLPGVFADPIVDLRIQWKACGTLVGSFNLFVYGTLYFLGEKITGDGRYARSRMAYALLGVGLLNSFTNFAHHTYHVPQSEVVKWISFVVSMTEVVILAKAVWDLAAAVATRGGDRFEATRWFVGAARWWTCGMLFTSVIISIPPLNSLIHGTQVVTGHAMGTEIGIDSMILFAAISWLLCEAHKRRGVEDTTSHCPGIQRAAWGFNVGAAVLVVWLHIAGSITGWYRYQGLAPPAWVQSVGPWIMVAGGFTTALGILWLLKSWVKCLLPSAETRPTEQSTTPAIEAE